MTCEYWPIQALTAGERLAMTNASLLVSRGGPCVAVSVTPVTARVRSDTVACASTLCAPFGSRSAVHVCLRLSYSVSQCAPGFCARRGTIRPSTLAILIACAAVR